MVGYPIFNAKLAKPPICEIDLHLRAQLPLRADRKYVAYQQHPDHQHRINRRSTGVRVVRRKLLVHPIKIKDPVDLPDQMIRRHQLVEIERVEELTLSALSPSHHRPLPRITSRSTESRLKRRLNKSFATQSSKSDSSAHCCMAGDCGCDRISTATARCLGWSSAWLRRGNRPPLLGH